MDPNALAMIMQAMTMQQHGGGPREHPLGRAFGAVPMYGSSRMPIRPMVSAGALGFEDDSPMGGMLAMLMQSVLPQMMGPNYVPGQFSPTQNFADFSFGQRLQQERRTAITAAAPADTETYFRMIRGMARARGVEYQAGPGGSMGQQEASARRFAGDIAQITPILGDMFPDLVDRMHGIRGSAQMMARSMFDGGRYTMDSATGLLGMSGASAGAMSNQVFGMLYGPQADLSRMRGLGAGRAGQLYDELVQRGFAPPPALDANERRRDLINEMSQRPQNIRNPALREQRRSLLSDTGDGATDNMPPEVARRRLEESVNNMNPQAFEAASRSFDATRTARTLERMSGAVAAMRDIFGDMGRPNAPMVELLSGLQAMTQGGMSHMSPAQLERSVRETHAIAQRTGIGTQGMMGLMGTAGQLTDQAGVSRAFAPQIAQSSALYGFAFGMAGQPTALGALDREQASQLDMRLRANAVQSPQFARLAALMQFNTELVRPGNQRGLRAGSEAAAMAAAVAAGETEYTMPPPVGSPAGTQPIRRSIFRSAAEMQQILIDGGVDRNQAATRVMQSAASAQRYGQQYNLQDLVRQGQGVLDIDPTTINVYSQATGAAIGNRPGMTARERSRLASNFGRALVAEENRLFDEQPELFSTDRVQEMHAELATRLRTSMGAQLGNIGNEEVQNLVANAFQSGEAFIQQPGSPQSGYGSITGRRQMRSQRVQNLSQRVGAETRAVAQVQSAMASVGQSGLITRISDLLQSTQPGGMTFHDIASVAGGGIPTQEIVNSATAVMEHIADLGRQIEDAPRRGFTGDALRTERARLTGEIHRLGPSVNNIINGNMDELDPHTRQIITQRTTGQGAPDSISGARADVRTAARALATVREDAINATPGVTAAQRVLRDAQTNVRNRTDAINNATDAGGRSVASYTTELEQINTRIDEATRPNSTVTPAALAALISQRTALNNAREAILITPAGQQRQAALTEAQGNVTRATEGVATARALAAPTVDNTYSDVLNATTRLRSAEGVLNTRLTAVGQQPVQAMTPQQATALRLREQLGAATEAAYGRVRPVQEARTAHERARTDLSITTARIDMLTATPQIMALDARMGSLISEETQLTGELHTLGPNSPRRQQVQRRLRDISNERNTITSERAPLVTAAIDAAGEGGPNGLQAQQVAQAAAVRDTAQAVRTAQGLPATAAAVAADPIVANLQSQLAAQNGQPGSIPPAPGAPGIPGVPPMPGAPGVTGVPPGPVGAGQRPTTPNNVQSMAINSQRTTMTGAVQITAQTVQLSSAAIPGQGSGSAQHPQMQISPTVPAQWAPAHPAQPQAREEGEAEDPGASTAQRITGTLTLVGLDTVMLSGNTASNTNDPRGPDNA